MKHKLKFIALGCLAWGAVAASTAHAEVVASYQFTGGSLMSSDTSADSNASPISVVNASSVNNAVKYTADQVATNPPSYVEFTVTPLTSLSFIQLSLNATTAGLVGGAFTVDFKVNGSSIGSLPINFNSSLGIGIPINLTTGSHGNVRHRGVVRRGDADFRKVDHVRRHHGDGGTVFGSVAGHDGDVLLGHAVPDRRRMVPAAKTAAPDAGMMPKCR